MRWPLVTTSVASASARAATAVSRTSASTAEVNDPPACSAAARTQSRSSSSRSVRSAASALPSRAEVACRIAPPSSTRRSTTGSWARTTALTAAAETPGLRMPVSSLAASRCPAARSSLARAVRVATNSAAGTAYTACTARDRASSGSAGTSTRRG